MEELNKLKRELKGLNLEIKSVKDKLEMLKEKKLKGLLEEKENLTNKIKSLKEDKKK